MKKNQKKSNQEARTAKANKAQSSSVKRQMAAAREAQATLSKFAGKTVTTRKKNEGGAKTPKKLVGMVRSGLHPESDLGLWAHILSSPFKVEGLFCPVSYNPAPSFIQSTARTTCTALSATVAATSTNQYVFWPGHYLSPNANSIATGMETMDAVAYHATDVLVNTAGLADRYVVGPMNKRDNVGTRTAICGVGMTGVTVNQTWSATNNATSTPLGWDVPLPYESDARTTGFRGHHSRWQCVAIGLRFRQTTPELARGGSFITVQPNNVYEPANNASQSVLEQFPTFKDHGPEGFEISWIPRAQDLAFWHGTPDDSASGYKTSTGGGGVYVFVNNPTAGVLSFDFQVVYHWQLAGTYLNTVGRPGAHAPETKPAVEKAISHMQNGSHTAAQAPKIMSKAVDHDGAKSPESWYEAATRAYGIGKKAVGVAGRVAASIA